MTRPIVAYCHAGDSNPGERIRARTGTSAATRSARRTPHSPLGGELMRTTLAILTAVTLAGCNVDQAPTDETESELASDLRPDGKGLLTRDAHASSEALASILPLAKRGNGISYHGG